MGKSKKMKKCFNYDKNRKRAWKKQKTIPKVKCDVLEKVWDAKMTHVANLSRFGLSHDPNATIRIQTTKELLLGCNQESSFSPVADSGVVQALEGMAKVTKKPPKQTLDDYKFCQEMISRHKNDYNAMARDSRNFYQLTSSQIRKKINVYMQLNKHDA